MNLRISLGKATAAALVATSVLLALTASSAMAAPPANDNFSAAATIGPAIPIDVSGTTVEATAESGEPSHASDPDSPDTTIWYQWQPSTTQNVRVDICDSTVFTLVAVYTGTAVNALTQINANEDGGCGFAFKAIGGTSYKIAIETLGTTSGDEGNTNLKITAGSPPPNDDFANSILMGPGLPDSEQGDNTDATRETGEPAPAAIPGTQQTVWYRWTPSSSQAVTLNTCTSSFDTTLGVYTGSAVNALTTVAADDDSCVSPNGLGSQLVLNAVSGTTYRIAVGAFNGGPEGDFTLAINANQVATPPVVPVQTPPKKKKKKCKKKKGKSAAAAKKKCKKKKK